MVTVNSARPLDWESAAWWASTLAPVGPTVTMGHAKGVATHLKTSAARAPEIVAELTGLHAGSKRAQTFDRLVIDRGTWAKANVDMFATMMGPHLPEGGNLATAQVAAAELGGLLGLMSTRVLGQFDPYTSRLYLLAPNIIDVRRRIDVDEVDFGMWVALHEQTHAVQFGSAPWLADHLHGLTTELLESMTTSQWERFLRALKRAPKVLRGYGNPHVGALMYLVLSDEELTHVEQIGATMSLLEGHADVVMDSATDVIPAIPEIRKKFGARRTSPRAGERIVRKATGMDAKLRQYSLGATFVRGVIDRVGHEGFNLVFQSPHNLPTSREIDHPGEWVARVAT